MSERQPPPPRQPDDDQPTVRRSPQERIPGLGNRQGDAPRRAPRQPEAPRRTGKRARRRGDQPPPPPEPPEEKSGLYVPWWGFVIVILVVAALTCGMWYFVLANRGDTNVAGVGPSPTPIFVVITATPTLGAPGETPGGVAQLEPSVTPTLDVTATSEATAAPASIQVGSQVVVEGTDGAGLAVRQGPGVSFTFFFIADDGDEFIVEAGPREADGYTWWYLSDPADANRAGWAVADYLQVQTSGGLQEATAIPASEGEGDG